MWRRVSSEGEIWLSFVEDLAAAEGLGSERTGNKIAAHTLWSTARRGVVVAVAAGDGNGAAADGGDNGDVDNDNDETEGDEEGFTNTTGTRNPRDSTTSSSNKTLTLHGAIANQ